MSVQRLRRQKLPGNVEVKVREHDTQRAGVNAVKLPYATWESVPLLAEHLTNVGVRCDRQVKPDRESCFGTV